MTPADIKRHLTAAVTDARRLTDTFTAVSVALRNCDVDVIADLCTAGPDGLGMEHAAQHVRIELAALDRALALVGEELIARRQRIAQARRNANN